MRIDIAKFEINNDKPYKVELYELLGPFNISEFVVTDGTYVGNFPYREQAERLFKGLVLTEL